VAYYPVVCAVAFAVLVGAAWRQCRRTPARAAAVLAALGGGIVSFVLGQVVMGPHARPSSRHLLAGPAGLLQHQAFPPPSATAAMAGAVVTGMFLAGRRHGLIAAAMALAIGVFQVGYERYALTDVIAAGLVGFAIVLCSYAVAARPLAWLACQISSVASSRRRDPAGPARSPAGRPAARHPGSGR